MANVLVTGATGFIGTQLVRHLSSRGDRVTCLVRSTSDRRGLQAFAPQFLVGDLSDRRSLDDAVRDCDVVFNLAGTTKALRQREFEQANVLGPRLLAEACADRDTPPTLVHVSSLAAAGPCNGSTPRTETDDPTPVSDYGKSKLRGEAALLEFAASVPISILRPPIVLGPGDRDGFEMFGGIAKWNLHLVPGFADHLFSVIDVDDLCHALQHVASSGKRVCHNATDRRGIYFAAADETPTYAELGQMIGRSLGKQHVWIVRSPSPLIWTIATINSGISRLRGRPHILSIDKAREATAGSWACDATRLRQETGFQPAKTLQERIDETTSWYIDNGWIKHRP
ncbi:NAD-dependent epimerase/dehydratase family protein [Rhodopirellula sp. JC639]|uniref:NAD-dependent epimerase/dehydratase family protein n=1 Tax=Stieleria mannarensis TaxID=2755585 RepID=UPI001602ECB2|nr:NAD-dependent epimerase/dehydratase family protein [Rhodopirellula sp. JC639]